MRLLREANTVEWTGKQVRELDDLAELEEKASQHLDVLLEERERGDERRWRLEKNLEILREVQEEERSSRSFFSKLKTARKREEIFALVEEEREKESGEKKEIEHRKQEDIERICTGFYKDLWKKRKVSKQVRAQMIKAITRKVTEAMKESVDKEITKEEMKKTAKKMRKGAATGIDGVPAEFYQEFDYVVEWLHELLLGEMKEKGEMTASMRTAVVILLFKKKEKNRIENYRPISLLTADYKLIAKILTERMKKVLKMVIGPEQQGFIDDGDIMGNLLLVKEIIEHCEEEDMEGMMIMMDFMKAYDRVDRETVMLTMKAMNFWR